MALGIPGPGLAQTQKGGGVRTAITGCPDCNYTF